MIADAIARVARGETVLSPRVQGAIMAGIRERADQEPPVRLSAATVKSYLQRLYDKLGVSDRAAAVAEGMRRGLLE